ncbi:MAG TPA: DUF4242 domain-containing protein [Thermoflexia bacterium]|nr:DUF4242 domain-containing protein [Thermoflexia bacterium]
MTKFIVVHRLPDVATQDEVIAAGKTVAARLSDDARWLGGWIVPADERLLCEWEASSAEAIQMALEGVNLLPVEAIYLAEPIDPTWFAE